MSGVVTSNRTATPGPTEPTSPSRPNGPPETVKNITATRGPSRNAGRRGRDGSAVIVCESARRFPRSPSGRRSRTPSRAPSSRRSWAGSVPRPPRTLPPSRSVTWARTRAPVAQLAPPRRAVPRRHAPAHVLVPARHPERDAAVQLVEGGAGGRGVHDAHQHETASRVRAVQERRRPRGVEAEHLAHRPAPVREVVNGLLHTREELPEPISFRDVHVAVARQGLPHRADERRRAPGIGRTGRPR